MGRSVHPLKICLMNPSQKTCLITGSRGYLGSCVKAMFQKNGWSVRELIRNPSAEEVDSASAVCFRLGWKIAPDALAGASALVHCAYDFQQRSWEKIRETNVAGSERLFSAARSAGVGKMIFISTMSAFDGCKSLYGKSKLEIEKLAFAHDAQNALVLRPGLIHGDSPRAMFGSLVSQVKSANVVPIFGDGSQVLYLVRQEDLCQLILDHAEGRIPKVAEPVTAAHPQGWTFRQVLEEIARAKGRQLRFVKLPWRPVWAAIRLLEALHVPLKFRSDSLLSLMNQNEHPSFANHQKLGIEFRPFQIESIRLDG